MKQILILALAGVGGYAVYKYVRSAAAKRGHAEIAVTSGGVAVNPTAFVDPAGVPAYRGILIPNRVDQIAAFSSSNPDATVEGDYYPAFNDGNDVVLI